tara:strand:+ start:1280 stop:1753 length:474 start_codon:yes stop_codon:yes gene_type:complete
MQISKQELEQIIKEEIDTAIEEGWMDRLKARASGVGAGVRGVGKRIAGTAKYAAGGEAPSTAGAIGGSYGHEKKVKIIDLHKKKIEQTLLKIQPLLEDRIEDMEKDLAKLGVADSEGAQNIINLLGRLSDHLPKVQSDFSAAMTALLKAVGSGEMTE